MIGPLLVIGGGVAGLGISLYWLKRWADERMEPKPNGKPSPVIDETKKKKVGGGGGGQGDKCARTGERYDAGRWSSPFHVAAGLISLGYFTTPALTTKKDKKSIRKFQTDATALNLNGMVGAGSDWHDGKIGACTLLALSNAEALLKSGKWIKRTQENWFEANWVDAIKALLEKG